MAEEDDVNRRVTRLEDGHDKINETLQQLVVSNNRVAVVVEQLNDVLPRLHTLEIESSNTKMVVNAIKWLAITIGSGAVIMIMAYLFGGQ